MRRFSVLDIGAVAAFAMLAAVVTERQRHRDIEAPQAATVVAAAPSCQDMLENRRFVMRRMLIADGSLALGSAWRNSALSGTCPKD